MHRLRPAARPHHHRVIRDRQQQRDAEQLQPRDAHREIRLAEAQHRACSREEQVDSAGAEQPEHIDERHPQHRPAQHLEHVGVVEAQDGLE
jgi:hypothetical protein